MMYMCDAADCPLRGLPQHLVPGETACVRCGGTLKAYGIRIKLPPVASPVEITITKNALDAHIERGYN